MDHRTLIDGGPSRITIPGCRIVGIAGRGGMGTVYMAEQDAPRRRVAIKVLSAASVTPASLEAFHREASLIAQLEHPNVLPLYGYGEVDGQPYLILRYLSGGSVAHRLERKPVEPAAAARWLRSVADALDFAHRRGLVHRDVKPSNMLLDETGNVYLADFGIAATLAPGAAQSGDPTGSAPYMAPEQVRGHNVDRRADIYSLAVSLFEMLTGQKPYTAETALGVMVRHINDPIPSARALNPAISPAVDELIQWGMAKEPAARPQTAAEFSRLLDQALARPNARLRPAAPAGAGAEGDATVLTPEIGARPIPAVPARRGVSPAVWVAAGLVALCVLGGLLLGSGGLAAFLLGARTPTPFPSATPPPSAVPPVLTPTPVGQLLRDDFADPSSGFFVKQPGEDPDGHVVYAGGVLSFTVVTAGKVWYSPSGRVDAQDVLIEVDVQQVAGPGASVMAVICRWRTPRDHVAFAISGDGHYSIWKERDDVVTRLVDWTEAPALAGDGWRRLAVTCAGERLSLAVDGAALAEVVDPEPLPGDMALMVGLREPGALVVAFDNLLVREPLP